jgi:RNA polymerase sigma-70 factor (ECF subfamily)
VQGARRKAQGARRKAQGARRKAQKIVEPLRASGVHYCVDSDEALYRRVKGGDLHAFDTLYERYEARLFGFLRSMLKNRADAEDVFHEAFLRTLKSRDVVFDREGGFRTWLYRIARNLALNHHRSEGRGARAVRSLGDVTHDDGPPPADKRMADGELLAALDQAVTRLPPALVEIFQLRSSGLSYEEMATVLETPIGTIKSRMNQMVTQLREELRPWTAR